MSGPIVRKYGFPNFEKIFGERPLPHGLEEEPPTANPKPPTVPKPADSPAEPAPSDPKMKPKS